MINYIKWWFNERGYFMLNYLMNGHNQVHLVGSGLLYLLCFGLFHSEKLSFIISFGLGILWELCDQFFGERFHWILDPRGLDWRDILADFVGVIIGAFILQLILRGI